MNFISLLSDATVGPTRTEGTWQLEGCGRKTAVAGKEKKRKRKNLNWKRRKREGLMKSMRIVTSRPNSLEYVKF